MLRKLILVVEDTAADEALILRTLKHSGIDVDVVVVRDGQQALGYLFERERHVESEHGYRRPDVILSDLNLPKVDGVELLSRVRSDAATRDIPIVLFSASPDADDRQRAYSCNVNSYVQKPVNAEDFSKVVRHVAWYWLVVNEPPAARATRRAEEP